MRPTPTRCVVQGRISSLTRRSTDSR
jgi:hypothetical protein